MAIDGHVGPDLENHWVIINTVIGRIRCVYQMVYFAYQNSLFVCILGGGPSLLRKLVCARRLDTYRIYI